MPLDAICIAAVRDELATCITGHKIDKVQQPERDVILLTLRGNGLQSKLLISLGAGDARIHLTEHRFDNPKSAPMFCMLLRKHLIGARIISIEQPQSERTIILNLSAPDAMGVLSDKQIYVELFGRQPNIILTNNDGLIIDCLRRIGGEMSDRRAVLPGLVYVLPTPQPGKIDPLDISVEEFSDEFEKCNEKSVDKWLINTFSAISPLISREISWRSYGDTSFPISSIFDDGESLIREFYALMLKSRSVEHRPWIVRSENGDLLDFSYTNIKQYENTAVSTQMDSFSTLLDLYFTRTAQQERIRQRVSATLRLVNTALERTIRKLATQHEELKNTEKRDTLRENGDIITTNLHNMMKGSSLLIADDFYSGEDTKREIKLDPLKTPQENAARYYKEYTKAKNAEKYLIEQIQIGEREKNYLESVISEIELAQGEQDLRGIRNELEQTGYIKASKGKNVKGKNTEASPLEFVSSTGYRIYAGRNNTENDRLTLKTASKSDIWLHVQKAHGSHVIISSGNELPDEETLYEAAVIAAYYSKARSGGKVPIDYAFVKHIKKPNGARPGMVIYTDYKTIIASSDEELVTRLKRN